jgi:Zn-dependent peptidase ImmA (M78 family)/DNA-binding XRE family transcriptional regulator
MAERKQLNPAVLGQRLAEARKQAGHTQQEAAEQLDCSRPTLNAIEKGTRAASAEEIVKLAAYYGRSVHDLVRPGEPAVALEPHLRAAVDATRADADEVNQAIKVLERFAEDYQELERLTHSRLAFNYLPEYQLPESANLITLAENVAARERARLLLGDQPVLNLRYLLEAEVGVRVFYGPLPSAIAGMYASVQDLGYCILINVKHPSERRRASLAHEYAHFLVSRHRPGIDYLSGSSRRPPIERFADLFAMSFLIPQSGVTKQFHEIVDSRGDFQVADLCRLSGFYFVSVQALALRLEGLGLIPKGTWDYLVEKGLRPTAAREAAGVKIDINESDQPYPERYKYLAVQAFQEEKISEGQLASFLRCDRVTAREIVEDCQGRLELDAEGNPDLLQLRFEESMLKHS